MTGRMNKTDKILQLTALAVIIASITAKAIIGCDDTDVLVVMSIVAIMLYVIFLVCSFFPATWRMTIKQKGKIKDEAAYQNRYRRVLAVFNLVVALLLACLIIFTC